MRSLLVISYAKPAMRLKNRLLRLQKRCLSLRLTRYRRIVLLLLTLLALLLLSLRFGISVGIVELEQVDSNVDTLESIGQYIFNAYFDTRPTLGGDKFARIISVLDTAAYSGNFVCQFANDDGEASISSVARKSAIGFGMPFGKHYYKEYLLSCLLVGNIRFIKYVYIRAENRANLTSRRIEIRHNPLSRNESPQKERLIVNCVSVTFGRPSEHRLIEWLEAQRLLKMDTVELHLYHVLDTAFEARASAYSAEGLLELRRIECPFCEPGKEDHLALLLMSPAINQCFYENLGGYQFTAVFDLDEIILPQMHLDYAEMLDALEAQTCASSFAFTNWYHFSELGEDPTVAEQLYMLRHPYRTRSPSPVRYSTKSIHRSSHAVALHNHYCWEIVPDPGAFDSNYNVELDLGVLEHYKKCHFGEDECRSMTRVSDRQDGSRLNQLIGRQLAAAFWRRATPD